MNFIEGLLVFPTIFQILNSKICGQYLESYSKKQKINIIDSEKVGLVIWRSDNP